MHLFSLLFPIAVVLTSPEEGVRRIRDHFLIDDPMSALEEAEELIAKYPESRLVGTIHIEALAAVQRIEEALDAFDKLSLQYPDLIYDRHLLEELSWGVLKKGLGSSQNGVRLAALIGIYLTHDIRAVPIFQKMMRDSNAVIRSVAIQMSCTYGDAPLKDEIARMLEEEKVWMVRLEVIKAIGALKIKSLAPKLKTIIESMRSTYEERQLAIEAVLNIYEEISLEQLQVLAKDSRAGMRHLACSIAAFFQIDGAEEEILKLIQDPHPDVQIAALNAFGLGFREKISKEKSIQALQGLLLDSHPAVAITASWAAILVDPTFGTPSLKKWLSDPMPENRRLAAAALSSTGGRGMELVLETLRESQDPYVKANLAIGVLGQRIEIKLCCDSIYDFLTTEKRMWMWDTRPNPLFQILAPSQVRYVDHIPNYPEAIDQITRLNLVSYLAIVEDERALAALKSFLQKKTWGISGVAAATLLQEGDESALEIVRECLNDSDPNVQLQACLVLAMFGRDESVLSDLQKAYAGADHERKLHILEALGRIGTDQSYSFLIGCLREPFPILRVATAAALIQCLNR
ncbi:MAG TPA: HEAT repeat domain-containing protein [Chlamydiales bacterium]|nr:HEAT repeat domain-containing protein [Chlamydiales bacterium]